MKKTLRGIAAIVASAMVASALGAVNAFADVQIIEKTSDTTDTTDAQTGTVNLQIAPYQGTHTAAAPEDGYDASENHIWSISANTSPLVWNVQKNTNGGTYRLAWDPVNHKYQASGAQTGNTTFTMYNNDTADKSITIINDSNFAVAYDTSITNNVTGLFSITSGGSGTLPVYTSGTSHTAQTTVTIDTTKLDNTYWTANLAGNSDANETTDHTAVTVGTLTYTFSVPQSGGDPVPDTEGTQYYGGSNANAEP